MRAVGGLKEKAAVWPDETASANANRLNFILEQLRPAAPAAILDVGCGTGAQLTGFVAAHFPKADVTGVDEDPESVRCARDLFRERPNLNFTTALPATGDFDVIILSEVLEHVNNPVAFLSGLGARLKRNGLIIVTVPNGYGCSEIMSTLEALYQVSGLRYAVNRLLRRKVTVADPSREDSLAASPHIQFFSFKDIHAVFGNSGYAVAAYRGRMFLHNFFVSRLLNLNESWCRVNAGLGRKLPPVLISGWMFSLKRAADPMATTPLPPANLYSRLKRRLNQKRFESKR